MMTLIEAVRPYAEAGLRPVQIAAALSLQPNSVRSLMAILRRRGVSVPRHKPRGPAARGERRMPLATDPTAWSWVLREVCEAHRVQRSEIIGPRQTKKIAAARHEAVRRMRFELGMGVTAIGRRVNRDHSVIGYICAKAGAAR